MGRNKGDFHAQILYHGTPAALSPGDTVNPGREGVAFATHDLLQAHFFGGFKLPGQGAEHNTYEVQPIGDVETKYADSDMPYYGSREGLRVVSKVSCPHCD